MCRALEGGPVTDIDVQWSIDANAAWPLELATALLPVLTPYRHRIFMIEQPFPLGFLVRCVGVWRHPCGSTNAAQESATETVSGWRVLCGAYEAAGLPVFADESVCCAHDIELLQVRRHPQTRTRPVLLRL
jgi:hypothetical protein